MPIPLWGRRALKLALLALILNLVRKIGIEIWIWNQMLSVETEARLSSMKPMSDFEYIPRTPMTLTEEIPLIYEPLNMCRDLQKVRILFLILSTPGKTQERRAMRETWLRRIAFLTPPTRVLFVIGVDSDETKAELHGENTMHNDILLLQLEETYTYIALKTLRALKWTAEQCGNAQLIMKLDDDSFVFPDRLAEFANGITGFFEQKTPAAIYGACMSGAEPVREPDVKWSVSTQVYPFSVFPKFCSGVGYLLTGGVPRKLLKASREYKGAYVPIEDVLISGILAELADVPRKYYPGFTRFWFPLHRACRHRKLLLSHRVRTAEQIRAYAEQCISRKIQTPRTFITS